MSRLSPATRYLAFPRPFVRPRHYRPVRTSLTMGVPQETLAGFLRRAKLHLQAALLGTIFEAPLTFVIGNQSADLDSMSSAILYAYFQTWATRASPVIPVLSVPSADIALRPEFAVAFRHAGIDPIDLVTLSDFPYPPSEAAAKLPPECTLWVLVDHNKLEGELAPAFAERVVAVLDHHADEDAVAATADPRRIEVCGSCTSLVVDHFTETWEQLFKDPSNAEANAQIARLALASILVDTGRLKNDAKTVAVDKESAELCQQIIRRAPSGKHFKKKPFTAELEDAKRDVSALSASDILRKDYKAWTEANLKLGMSSVVTSLAFLRDKASDADREEDSGWSRRQREFMEEKGLHLHAVIAPFVDESHGQSKKDRGKGLLIRWRTGLAANVVDNFEEMAKDELKLSRTAVEGLEQDRASTRIWTQGDRTKTRKQVGPLLRKAMRAE